MASMVPTLAPSGPVMVRPCQLRTVSMSTMLLLLSGGSCDVIGNGRCRGWSALAATAEPARGLGAGAQRLGCGRGTQAAPVVVDGLGGSLGLLAELGAAVLGPGSRRRDRHVRLLRSMDSS